MAQYEIGHQVSEVKPAHLSGEYGAWFKDPLLAAAYPARPPYPDGVIHLLAGLIRDTPGVVLDVGCGSGELARRLSPYAERVDAVDFSDAMLELARRLPAGNAENIRWTLGAVEDVPLNGPYALVTAGQSMHWMDLDVVMSRFPRVWTPNGSLPSWTATGTLTHQFGSASCQPSSATVQCETINRSIS